MLRPCVRAVARTEDKKAHGPTWDRQPQETGPGDGEDERSRAEYLAASSGWTPYQARRPLRARAAAAAAAEGSTAAPGVAALAKCWEMRRQTAQAWWRD